MLAGALKVRSFLIAKYTTTVHNSSFSCTCTAPIRNGVSIVKKISSYYFHEFGKELARAQAKQIRSE